MSKNIQGLSRTAQPSNYSNGETSAAQLQTWNL